MSTPPEIIPIPEGHNFVVDHNIKPVETSLDDFLPESKSQELFDILNGLSYTKNKGRSTIKFGQSYTYNGSREDSISEFPPAIKSILDSLNKDFVLPNVPPLNSCLVTKYSGPGSFLPEHSDNETSIHPESSIFTVSVGSQGSL